jgi:hypothetical protein
VVHIAVIDGPGVLVLDARHAWRIDHKARELRSQSLQKILDVRLCSGLPSTLMYLDVMVLSTLSIGNAVNTTVTHHQPNESTPVQIARFVRDKFPGKPGAIGPQVHGIAIVSDSRDLVIDMSGCTGLVIPLARCLARRIAECN